MPTRIELRGAGRRLARELLTLIESRDPELCDALMDELRSQLLPEVVAAEAVATQKSLKEASAWVLPFGMHQGLTLAEAPREYVSWLADQSLETHEVCRRYITLSAEDPHDDENEADQEAPA